MDKIARFPFVIRAADLVLGQTPLITAVVILLTILLAGCATKPAPIEDPRQVWCDYNAPRYVSPQTLSAMSRWELDDFNAHNAKGQAWCGWEP